jgi:hypothetical protein
MRPSGTVQPTIAPACEERNSDLRPVFRMGPHQTLPYRPEGRDFLRRQIGEPDRFA